MFDDVRVKLYILKIYNELESFYKIGITSDLNIRVESILKSINSRIDNILDYKIEVLYTYKENKLNESYNLEKLIKQSIKKRTNKITFTGESETFNISELRKVVNIIKLNKTEWNLESYIESLYSKKSIRLKIFYLTLKEIKDKNINIDIKKFKNINKDYIYILKNNTFEDILNSNWNTSKLKTKKTKKVKKQMWNKLKLTKEEIEFWSN